MSDTQNNNQAINEADIDNLVKMLDGFANSGEGRMNLKVTEDVAPGETAKAYHHGRCDVGSVWAKGKAFDVLEEANKGDCN